MTAHPSAVADALVVGGGPAGTAAAIRIARAGHEVVVVERGPAPKACGGLLTPRAVAAVDRLELPGLAGFHRVDHVRLTADGRSTSTRWPAHPALPHHGYAAPRERFDALLTGALHDAGVRLLTGHEAIAPIVERGFVRGAHVVAPDGTGFEARAGYTIVADGANSRFGRALGTFRQPAWPHALAHRAVYRSPLHDATEIEVVVDLHDRVGTPITGYGWMFPVGDGTVNVGVLMMSTSPSFRVISPAHLLDRFVADHAGRWQLAAEPTAPPAGGRIPLGNSVGPAAGPTYLSVGDAVGAANPLSGAGIEYALETGNLAGEVVLDALASRSSASLQRYPQLLAARYGSYYKVGRLADQLLGRPTISRRFGTLAAGHRTVADAVVRIVAGELRPGRASPAELAYRLGRALTIVAPDA